VIINEVPTYRADNMPYGGMKESGVGREGVSYTMKEYCDIKTIVHWKSPNPAR
jgi:acyl-CoA reductase-like NAD-dependent aldehyde dehydrogenase